MTSSTQNRIYHLLQRIPNEGLSAVKELFWTELNYDHANRPLSQRDWSEAARDAVAGPAVLLAQHGDFAIIYTVLSQEQQGVNSPLSLTAERTVINQLKNDHPYALYLFSDEDEVHWHLVNIKLDQEANEKSERTTRRVFRRISIGPRERLRTASERIVMLDVASMQRDLFGLSPLAIQQRHDEAFDVEAVTEKFYQGYVEVFGALEADLLAQSDDPEWAHDFALQFLNRIMFLYYVQRKGWLNDDADFLSNFWRAYRNAERPRDTFVAEWLNILFFQAFNFGFAAGRSDVNYLPSEIRNALATAPYLNGGLFSRNELDDNFGYYEAQISDSRFQTIVSFLDSYNFTISEDTPLDQEVAVDPEMIGKVYESLVNVSDETDERGEAGIFYTPRVEIDLMCRLSLVDWLSNHLDDVPKELLYRAVFAFDPQEKEEADSELRRHDLWPRLDDLLRSVTAVDPACGSGSFLVGMLYVLDDLVERANDQLGREESDYERKKHIIGRSLYGVDVMDWAVHVAELRLWLQLVIETDLPPGERRFRPLLPNLSFKIRQGDSLVQEVGGVNLAQRYGSRLLSPQVKGRITQLKGEKLRFYNNDPDRRYQSKEALENAELQLFQQILDDRLRAIDARIAEIDAMLRPQSNLFGEVQNPQMQLDLTGLKREKERLQQHREQAARARRALRTANDVPFVWDIAFVEIFEGDSKGFDIVIGNPPYVRQEQIRDPQLAPEEVTTKNKKEYKGKLVRSVYRAWPQTFGYNWDSGTAQWKLDKKSDLYIYFYFHGLSLLNDKGIFCFITSNSWLDVGYGKDLQQFLLKRGHVRLLIDNQSRRSFASAAVNTVITLFGAARDMGQNRKAENPEGLARFVMLTVPFEQVLSPVIWEEIEDSQSRQSTPEYRLRVFSHSQLFDTGRANGQFVGDQWGGKYLRAPDIYWILVEKQQNKLIQLDELAQIRFGIKTGANAFFFLSSSDIRKWGIEEEYLAPVVKSPREVKSIVIAPGDLNFSLFMCNKGRNRLKSTAALEYIKWGEAQGLHHRPSVRGRTNWWDLGDQESFDWLLLRFRDKRNWTPINETPSLFASDAVFVARLYDRNSVRAASAFANSTLMVLFSEIYGRVNLGDGLLTTYGPELKRFKFPKPTWLQKEAGTSLVQALDVMKKRKVLSIFDEVKQTDRQALDNVIFDLLGLSQYERDAVYEAVISLVTNRSLKARSR